MPSPKIITVEDKIYWSYANLAMAHSAVTNNQQEYNIPPHKLPSTLQVDIKWKKHVLIHPHAEIQKIVSVCLF